MRSGKVFWELLKVEESLVKMGESWRDGFGIRVFVIKFVFYMNIVYFLK